MLSTTREEAWRTIGRNEYVSNPFHSPIVHYQSVIDLRSRKTVFYEALARITDNGQIVMPAGFIEVARATGQLPRLTAGVIGEVCDRLRFDHPRFPVSINVPFSCLTETFSEELQETMDRCGLTAADIIIEITEDEDTWNSHAVSVVEYLSEKGVKFIFDDFLGLPWQHRVINEFPLSGVKLDRMLLRATTGVLKMFCLDLKQAGMKKVVLEGVETREDYHRVADICAAYQSSIEVYAQGYYFGKPAAQKWKR